MPFYKKLFHKIKKEMFEWTPERVKKAKELVKEVQPPIGGVAKVVKVLPREFGLGKAWRGVKFPKPTKTQIEAAKEAQRRFDIIFTRGKETAKQVEKGLKKYFKGKW